MERENSRLISLVVVLGVLLAGSVWYIAHLRAENATLRAELPKQERPSPEQERPPREAGIASRSLSPEQYSIMIDILRAEPSSERAVWFATSNTPEAAAFQRGLQSVFEEAGWEVRGKTPVDYPLKPGVFFFMADEFPPSYAETALAALQAAGIAVTLGTSYRAYYAGMKRRDPDWAGIEMGGDQTYIVVIGRKPE